jgi:hypothetical protein
MATAHAGLDQGCDPSQPVPAWAVERDVSGCLVVDGGGSWGNITFQQHAFHYDNAPQGGSWRPTCPGATDVPGGCPTCNVVIWDSDFDKYQSGGVEGSDVWEWNTNIDAQHVLVKNVSLRNAWRCAGGTGWTGPNGHHCAPGESSGAHTDLWQLWTGPPENGGWLVAQDMVIENSDTQFFQWSEADLKRGRDGACADPGGSGIVFQNVILDQTAEYEQDCLARTHPASQWACAGNYGNTQGNAGHQLEALWYIDVHNLRGVTMSIDGDMFAKVISIGGSGGGDGWPGALKGSAPGPGTCPNGLVSNTDFAQPGRPETAIYCYDSIESALADTLCPDCPHTRPPFLELSPSGWATPP